MVRDAPVRRIGFHPVALQGRRTARIERINRPLDSCSQMGADCRRFDGAGGGRRVDAPACGQTRPQSDTTGECGRSSRLLCWKF